MTDADTHTMVYLCFLKNNFVICARAHTHTHENYSMFLIIRKLVFQFKKCDVLHNIHNTLLRDLALKYGEQNIFYELALKMPPFSAFSE